MTTHEAGIAHYLTNGRIGFRAPRIEDATQANRWLGDPLPMSPQRAEALLREQETGAWGSAREIRLIAVELTTGEIAGGAIIERQDNRAGKLRLHVPPYLNRDARSALCSEMLTILVPWITSEISLMTVVIELADDEAEVLKTAEQLGFREAVRFREHIQRPNGRVDLLYLEWVNLDWGTRHA